MNMVIALMKVVKCQQYAEDILNGKLYCNSIEWFRQNHDEFEGDYYTFPESITFDGITVTKNELVGPTAIYAHNMQNHFAYCMFGWFAPIKDDIVDIRLRDQIGSIGDLSKKFGPHTVIVDAKEFIERVENAYRRNEISGYMGAIHYADATELKPDSPRRAGFNKRERFSNEKEYRFRFDNQQPNCGSENQAFCLEIGNIRDISVCMKTEDIYSLLTSIGTKSFCEKYLGMKGWGEETPYDSQHRS